MRLTIKRLEQGRYETVVVRDDGVRFQLKGVAHMFAIPHDLAHFLVEKTLRLRQGFFGSMADGAVFKSMTWVDGRRKPGAAERSEMLQKKNLAALNDAEALVRIFNDTIEQGHAENSPVLQQRLRERLQRTGVAPRSFGADEIAEVYAAYRDMLAKWKKLPVGGQLELHW
jgi:hypothetical protein